MERIASPCDTRGALSAAREAAACQALSLCVDCPPVFKLKRGEIRFARLDLSACICCDCPDEINAVALGALTPLTGAAGLVTITQESFVYPELTLRVDASDTAITAGSRFELPLTLTSDQGETRTDRLIVKVI